jgi:hypothetical protein
MIPKNRAPDLIRGIRLHHGTGNFATSAALLMQVKASNVAATYGLLIAPAQMATTPIPPRKP